MLRVVEKQQSLPKAVSEPISVEMKVAPEPGVRIEYLFGSEEEVLTTVINPDEKNIFTEVPKDF